MATLHKPGCPALNPLARASDCRCTCDDTPEPQPPMPEGDESLARRLYGAYLRAQGLVPYWEEAPAIFQREWCAAAAAAEQWEQERVDAAQAALLDRETQPPMPPPGELCELLQRKDFKRIQRLTIAVLDGPRIDETTTEWLERLQEIACQLPDSVKGTK